LIPVCLPFLDNNDKNSLLEAIDSGWISSDGPNVSKFENEFSLFIGTKFGVAVSNGTAALETAVYALNLTKGDEIILPSFTIISCVIALLKFGCKPVLVDIEPDTWNMDVSQIESKITNNTKAIMAVHMYGHPCNMDEIIRISNTYNLKIIEDASQVHGAIYKDKKCGSIGHISTFSFYANKIITTGEGGMVLTSDVILDKRAREYRNLCFIPEQRFLHNDIGNNLRMTNLQASIGLSQLRKISKLIDIKRKNGDYYVSKLKLIKGLKTQVELDQVFMVYWMYCIELDESTNLNAKFVMNKLYEKGIGTRPFFIGMHEQPALIKLGLFKNEYYPITSRVSRQGFYLPSGVGLKKDEIDYIVDTLNNIITEQ